LTSAKRFPCENSQRLKDSAGDGANRRAYYGADNRNRNRIEKGSHRSFA
jgi:hypothetical protein